MSPLKPLDALALASMSEKAQLHRLAALWCRAHNDRPPYNASEAAKWVKREYGPLIPDERRERLAKVLVDEIKRQSRVRKRRADRDRVIDPTTLRVDDPYRLGLLLQRRLGSARRWTGKPGSDYIDGDFYSGLVAGLVPVEMRTRSISNPNLLVYRYRWEEPRTRYVATHITTVADAFIWLIPPEAAEFLQLPETRVEHDWRDESVCLYTPFGSKAVPWRGLASAYT